MLLNIALLQVPWLSGKPAGHISVYTLVSVAMICIGLFLYGRYDEISIQNEYKLDSVADTIKSDALMATYS